MNRLKRLLILTLCFVFICTGSVYAADGEEPAAEQTEVILQEETPEETAVPEEESDLSADQNEADLESPADPASDEAEDPVSGDVSAEEESVPAEEEAGQDEIEADPEEITETEEDAAAGSEEETDLQEDDQETAAEETEAAEPADEEEQAEEIEKADAEAVSAEIKILSSDEYAGSFKFSVEGLDSVSDISKVKLDIWHASDKSDRYIYTTTKQDDGTYTATMYKYHHQDHTGTYKVRAKVEFADGSSEIVANTTVIVKKKDPVLSAKRSGSEYTFSTKYIPNCSKISYIQYAIWSDKDGQDDLQWYEASINKRKTTSSFTSKLPLHSDTGLFHVHVYAYYTTGEEKFVIGDTFNRIIPGKASFSSFNITLDKIAGKFTMTVNGAYCPSGIDKVKIEVWCKGETKDKVSYTAKSKGSGRYSVTGNVKKHKYHRGTYHAKVYVVGKDGKKRTLTEQTFKMAATHKGLTIKTSDQSNYKVTLKKVTVPGGISDVQFAVWSDTGGQDDLVWYHGTGENGGDYKATVKAKNHKHLGLYHIHVYVTNAAGTQIFLKEDTFRIMPKLDYTLKAVGKKDGDGKFTVKLQVNSTTSPIKKVKFEVWRNADKSDVYWYHATGDSKGRYKAVINTANHYGHRGTFHINIYVVFKSGLEGSLTETTEYFKPSSYLIVPVSNGTAKRRVSYVNPTVSSVKFKVWTVRGGSGDSKTYKAKVDSKGRFYADVKMDHFTYDGKYNIEVYSGSTLLDSGSFIMLDYLEEAYKFAYDDSIGYSQINRCLNPDLDCSSLVHYALKNTGYNVGNGWPLTTYNEESVLRSVGFSMVKYTNISDLQPGDILLRDGHTEIYAGHGTTVGAHGDENDDIYGRLTGDQTGYEVCVAKLVENWLYSFRLITYSTQ